MERFSVRTTGGQTTKGARGMGKHIGVTGISQDQGGLGSLHLVLSTSDRETGPPNQGGPGPSVSGQGRALHMLDTRKTTVTHTDAAVGG